MIPLAGARRNSAHVGPLRRGAGPARAARSRLRTVVAPTRIPSLRSSPWTRTQPRRGFSHPGEPEDERADRGIGRRPAGASGLAVRPPPPHELAVPPQQRRRRDEEGGPAVARDRPARRGEEHPVHGPEPGRARRPPQHPELVAEDEDLEVLGAVVPATPAGADDAGDEGAEEQVDERPHQPIVPGRSERELGFPTPTGLAPRAGRHDGVPRRLPPGDGRNASTKPPARSVHTTRTHVPLTSGASARNVVTSPPRGRVRAREKTGGPGQNRTATAEGEGFTVPDLASAGVHQRPSHLRKA